MSKYTGPRTITVEFHPYEVRTNAAGEARGWTYAHYQAHIDGRSWYGLSALCADREATVDPGDTKAAAKARKSAENLAARLDADDAWYDRCAAVAGELTGPFSGLRASDDQTAADFFIGQKVAIHSRGTYRVGLVEKVGRTNVGVIYVTASTGAIWRKADKFTEVVILEAAAAPEYCGICGASGHIEDDHIEGLTQDEVDHHYADGPEPCDCSCHAPGDAGIEGCCPDSEFVPEAGPHFCYAGHCPETEETRRTQRLELGICVSCDEPALDDLETCDRHTAPRHRPAPTTDKPRRSSTDYSSEAERLLAGLRTERSSLRARTRSQFRPELEARLVAVEARIAQFAPYDKARESWA